MLLYSVACTPLIYAITAASLLAAAACDIDEGFKGRVTYRVTLAIAQPIDCNNVSQFHLKFEAMKVPGRIYSGHIQCEITVYLVFL